MCVHIHTYIHDTNVCVCGFTYTKYVHTYMSSTTESTTQKWRGTAALDVDCHVHIYTHTLNVYMCTQNMAYATQASACIDHTITITCTHTQGVYKCVHTYTTHTCACITPHTQSMCMSACACMHTRHTHVCVYIVTYTKYVHTCVRIHTYTTQTCACVPHAYAYIHDANMHVCVTSHTQSVYIRARTHNTYVCV